MEESSSALKNLKKNPNLKKAYDSVNCKALWLILQKRYHLPTKVVCTLEALHEGTTGAVRAYGRVSGEFPVVNGV